MTPRRRASEEQVRDIRARHEEHERDDDHQRPQRPLVAAPHERVARGRRRQRERLLHVARELARPPVGRQRRFANLRLHSAQRRLRRVQSFTGLQPRHHRQPPRRPAIEVRLFPAEQRLAAERHGDVERPSDFRAEEFRRRDADDRERHAVDRDLLPDDVDRAAVFALPVRVADDGNRAVGTAAAPVVGVGERPAENRRHAEGLEVPSAGPHAVDVIGFTARRQIEPVAGPRRGAREEIGSLPNLIPDRIRPRVVGERPRVEGLDERQPLRFLDRQRAEAVDQREDGRVRADAERERQRGDDRHDRGRAQRTKRELHVMHERPRRTGVRGVRL